MGMRNYCDITGISLTHNKVYYVTVRATNGARLQSSSVSDGILTDFTPPEFHNTSINEESVKVRCFPELILITWKLLSDAESGLDRYEVCVGHLENKCNIQSWTNVFKQTSFSKIVPKQTQGTKIYGTVRAINRAGIIKEIVPNGPCLINVKPKRILMFTSSHLQESPNTVWRSDRTSMPLRWSFWPGSSNFVSRLQLGVIGGPTNESEAQLFGNSLYGQPILLSFIDMLPWQQNVTLQTPNLEPNQDYHGVMKVYTSKGIYSEGISEGVVYDPTPPPRRQVHIKDIAAEKERNRWLPGIKFPAFNQTLVNPDVLYISDPSEVVVRIQDPKNSSKVRKLANSTSYRSPSLTKEFKIIITRFAARFNSSNSTKIKQEVNKFPALHDATSPCCSSYFSSNETKRFDSHFKTATNVDEFGASLATLSNDLLAVGAKGKAVIFSLNTKTSRRIHVKSIWGVSSTNQPDIEISSWKDKAAFFYRGVVELVQITQNYDDSIAVRSQGVISHCKTQIDSKITIKLSNISCDQYGSWSENGKIADAVALYNNTLVISGREALVGVIGIFRKNAKLGWHFQMKLGKNENDLMFGHSIAMNNAYLAVATGSDATTSVILYTKTASSSWNVSSRIRLRDYMQMYSPLTLKLTTDNTLVVLSAYSKSLLSFKIVSSKSPPLVLCKFISSAASVSEKLDVSKSNGMKPKLVAIGVKKSDNSVGLKLIQISSTSPDHQAVGDCLLLESFVTNGAKSMSYSRFPVKIHTNTVLLGTPSVPSWPNSILKHLGGRVYYATYCPMDHVRKLVAKLNNYIHYTCQKCKPGFRSFGGTSSVCHKCSGRKCSTNGKMFFMEEKLCTNKTCESHIPRDQKRLTSERFFLHGSHYSYYTRIIETSRAGVATSIDVKPFIIDATLPEIGLVYDGLGTSDSANCSSNETFGEHAQCTSRSLDETDIDYTSNTSEIHARWIDFRDNESDIAEFFWCVGKRPFRDSIKKCESTKLRTNASHYGLSLLQGDSYYVTVLACNSAGRCSAAASDGVAIDTTPPTMEYVRDGVMGPDMDFQVRINA